MDYEYWTKTINEEDRKINNANRRFRYHCYSLESMSEELIYQERSIFPQNDFTIELFNEDFIDTVQNEKLAKALRHLTDRQQQAIKLAFWEGYQYKEIAEIFQCSPAAVTLLLKRAFQRLRRYYSE
ncbi:RNA polymerase sigma factor [Holdemania massiliensis]|uniref:RNA polymerase sigma factor n=1 Tax=Holdemania massiliensis TaxID=1468449 RepID=UPI003520C81D